MKQRKSAQIVTRVTASDRAWVDSEAARHGLDPSSFIRVCLRRAREVSESRVLDAGDLSSILSAPQSEAA